MVIGFIDDTGRRLPFDRVGEGEWSWKRPFVLSMARQEQSQERLGDYRVSDLGPHRIYLLNRRYGYYVYPLPRIPMWKGSVLHAELAAQNGHELKETPLSAVIHGATLVGKPDHVSVSESKLDDYKFTKCYTYTAISAELLKEMPISHRNEYIFRTWTYDWLLRKNGYDVKKRSLIIDMGDWSATSWQSQPPEGTMELELPAPPADFEKWLFDWIETAEFLKSQPDEALPMCDEAVRYGKDKEGNWKRCHYYCDVRPFCAAIASHEQFNWEKGFMACVNLLTPPSKGAVMEILLQNFNVQDPAELPFRFQWVEVFEEIKRRNND